MFWNNQLIFIYFEAFIDIDHFIDLLRQLEEVTPDLGQPLKHIQLRIKLHMQCLLAVDGATDYHVFIDSNVIYSLGFAETFMVVVILLQDQGHAFCYQYLIRRVFLMSKTSRIKVSELPACPSLWSPTRLLTPSHGPATSRLIPILYDPIRPVIHLIELKVG
jgi:hypothetical protein